MSREQLPSPGLFSRRPGPVPPPPPSHRRWHGRFGSHAGSSSLSFTGAGGGSALAWQRARGRPGCMSAVLPKLPVESKAPRRHSGPELKEGGKAPHLPSSSLLPVSGRQEARCCRCAADEARCVIPLLVPSYILPRPGVELAVVMNWASCNAVVHLPTKRFFFVRAPPIIKKVVRKVGK
jgi:hypothetical protein